MILCCGEALIDMIPVKDAAGRTAYTPHPGGAVFNTAIALGRLGGSVGLLSGVSNDPFGEQLKSALTTSDVHTDLLIRSDRLTTLAMIHLQNGSATYSFYDENSAGRMIHPQDAPALPPTVTTMFFGGISLVNEPAADTYADFLSRWRAGRTVMLDPNIRPGFIQDATQYRDRLHHMIALADIVKMSEEDLNWFDQDAQPLAAARKLLDLGPRVVIMTQAETGAVAITAEGEDHMPAFVVETVDTVGAGDTFNAGFLFELGRSGALEQMPERTPSRSDLTAALRTGAMAAALCCARAGANPPRIEELQNYADSHDPE